MLNGVFCDVPLSAADGMVQKSKQTEADESKKGVDGGKESEKEKEKPALVNSEVMRKEVQEESVKPEEEVAEPASGKDGEGVIEGQKQEETKPVGEK